MLAQIHSVLCTLFASFYRRHCPTAKVLEYALGAKHEDRVPATFYPRMPGNSTLRPLEKVHKGNSHQYFLTVVTLFCLLSVTLLSHPLSAAVSRQQCYMFVYIFTQGDAGGRGEGSWKERCDRDGCSLYIFFTVGKIAATGSKKLWH